MSDFVLHKLEELGKRVKALEEHTHEPGYHEHLIDPDEFDHHLKRHVKEGDERKGERRAGERRKSTEKHEGEERRK